MNVSNCVISLEANSSITGYQTSFSPILQATGSLMKFLVRLSDETSIELIIKGLQKKEDPSRVAIEVIEKNIIIVLIFLSTLIIAGIIFIAFFIKLCCQLFSCVRHGKSSGKIYCVTAIFIICAALTIFCIVLIMTSFGAISHGLEQLPVQVDKSATHVEDFVRNLAQQLRCMFNNKVTEIDNEIGDAMSNVQKLIDNLRTEMNKLEDAYKKLGPSEQVLEVALDAIMVWVKNPHKKSLVDLKTIAASISKGADAHVNATKLRDGMNKFEQKLQSFGSQRKTIANAFQKVKKKMFGDISNEIVKFIRQIAAATKQFLRKNNFQSYINHCVRASLIVPMFLLTVCLVATAVLLLRWIFNCIYDNPEDGKRSIISRLAAFIMDVVGYLSMILSFLLFILSSLMFLVAFVAALACVGFFDDPELQVFRVIESVLMPRQQFAISVSEVFYKCKNDYSFFDAIDGAKLIGDSGLKEKFDLLMIKDARREIEKGIYNPPIPTAYEEFLDKCDGLYRNGTSVSGLNPRLKADGEVALNEFKKAVQDYITQQKAVFDKVEAFTSRGFTHYVTSVNDKLLKSIENFLVSLLDMSSRCGDIMTIWDDIKWFVCDLVAYPLSGIWSACLITAFLSIFIFMALFDATAYLKSFESTATETTPPGSEREPNQ